MKIPHMYINVSQTIFAVLAAGVIGNYIFRKEFRDDVNSLVLGISKARR